MYTWYILCDGLDRSLKISNSLLEINRLESRTAPVTAYTEWQLTSPIDTRTIGSVGKAHIYQTLRSSYGIRGVAQLMACLLSIYKALCLIPSTTYKQTCLHVPVIPTLRRWWSSFWVIFLHSEIRSSFDFPTNCGKLHGARSDSLFKEKDEHTSCKNGI